ncbi:protein BIG GRAIN 1-like B [Lactuca sativa]|uniref:protein BIG GRAIN 1-like B n=1 Tax=Lactuca sativa TaxID=4236 RepID=UPI000CBB599D|nr:protein BIG GRAIN 1-like B [Lactuca sativa]
MDAVDRIRYRCQREIPSFSSTLLDKIYRSIDERDGEEKSVVYRESVKKRQSIDGCFQVDGSGSKNMRGMVVGRKSVAGFESSSQRSEGNSFFYNSTLGSSCSGYGVGFSSSSEAETVYGCPARPKPIRTSTHDANECDKQSVTYPQNHQPEDLQPKGKRKGKFGKTKSGAMKIYGYLKKGKRPLSPGGRLAAFLISLFTTGNAKKSFCTGGDDEAVIHGKRESKSANASMPSSVSSFSRSCQSKTPSSSSRGNIITTEIKRSVRFYPGTVIVDEHRQPRERKSVNGDRSDSLSVKFARNSVSEEIQKHSTENKFHIEETKRNLLKNYQKKVDYPFDSIKTNAVTDNDEDDEDDSASYASSDLFELDHLSAIGMDQCMKELPLYETTSIAANRAIAKGLLV